MKPIFDAKFYAEGFNKYDIIYNFDRHLSDLKELYVTPKSAL
jgi:hypothetical protein